MIKMKQKIKDKIIKVEKEQLMRKINQKKI